MDIDSTFEKYAVLFTLLMLLGCTTAHVKTVHHILAGSSVTGYIIIIAQWVWIFDRERAERLVNHYTFRIMRNLMLQYAVCARK